MGTNLDAGVVAGVFILCGGKASRRGREHCTLILLLGEYLTELKRGRTFLSGSLFWLLW